MGRNRPNRRGHLLRHPLSFISLAVVLAAIAGRYIAVTYAQSTGQVIDVPEGGSLQLALNQIQPGGTIRLAPGATYVGTFTLPAKQGTDFIVITTADATLPAPGVRIDPGYKPGLATIRSSTTASAVTTAPGASYYRFIGVAFEANQNGSGDVIMLGRDSQTTLAEVPHHIEFDRVLVSGDPTVGQKRAIAANATHVVVANSDIRNIKAIGQDSQAVAAWNTPGPIEIRNNYLEAAGENIMFGGAHINLPGIVPSDITVENNLLTKNEAWRGTSWTVKNLFELKNARRVTVRRNIMQYNWGGAQAGFAVVLTPRNSSGRTPWVVVEDIEFSGNIVSYTGSGFNMLGHDDTDPSGQLARVVVRNNLLFDVSTAWEGSGIFAQLGGEPRDIAFDHNTVMHTGNIVTFYSGQYVNSSGVRVSGGPVQGFVFTNNLLKHNAYGIIGSGQGYGNQTLAYYAPGAIVQRNAMATNNAVSSRYPGDNQFPTVAAFMTAFRDVSVHDYRLVPGSSYINAGLDGRDLGCDFGMLLTSAPRPLAPARVRIVS